MAEELLLEIEAVQAVYGFDCHVIQEFPPVLNVHLKPRTADDSSQQFVKVVLGIRAGEQYPVDPPIINIIESKGLDEERRLHLTTTLQDKAKELSSCLMLVALCEEAVETLSNMNHPDGNCPLCLYPLVTEHNQNHLLPFMKLMSCFHCFHSECIIRWWEWLQEQNDVNTGDGFQPTLPFSEDFDNQRGTSASLVSTEGHSTVTRHVGNCPVCRKVFHTKDIEHVLNLLGTGLTELSLDGVSIDDGEKEILTSDTENFRKQKFAEVSRIQQEINGLIEPKKMDVLLPGMFLPEPATVPIISSKTTPEQNLEDCAGDLTLEAASSQSVDRPGTSKQNNSSARRKKRFNSTRKHHNPHSNRKQWIQKDKAALD